MRRLLSFPLLCALTLLPALSPLEARAQGSARPATVTVKRGETLYRIATRYGLRPEDLRAYNGLRGNLIEVGQVLRLRPVAPAKPAPQRAKAAPPKAAQKAPPRPAAKPGTYTVRRGDTLGRISKQVGLSVAQLQRLNGLRGTRIDVGQVLRLSGPAKALAPARAPARPAASRPTVSQTAPKTAARRHTVRSGDTLGALARRYGVSVGALRAANGLSGNLIRVGQSLKVPAPGARVAGPAPLPPGTEARLVYRYVRVGSGENAQSLAARHRITPDQLRRLNGLSSVRQVHAGQRLLVPQRVAVAVPPRPVRAPVTLRRAAPLGIAVQVVEVDLRWKNVLVSPVLPQRGLNFGSGARVSVLAARSGAQAVVNGSYFHPGTYAPAGDIVMQGRLLTWGRIPAALAITPDNRASISPASSAALGRPLDSTWKGMETVIASGPQILKGGVVQTSYSRAFRDPALFGRAARSALGLRSSRDLLLVSTHAKLSTVEMGKVMQALGARDALLLDGGSSTGLAWNGAAVIDSVRKVSYGIGVFSNYEGRRYAR